MSPQFVEHNNGSLSGRMKASFMYPIVGKGALMKGRDYEGALWDGFWQRRCSLFFLLIRFKYG